MPHDHSHHHHHIDPEAGDLRVAAAIGVNLLLTVAQIIGGILSGSLALIADAIHNLSDAISLVLAFGARKIARRPSDDRMTFGYGRIETVAALINYTTLIMIGLWLMGEAVMRFTSPEPVEGWTVVILAGLALGVDTITAMLTFRLAKESVNIRAAFLHNLADALGSVAVIIAGIAILVYGWWWVDPLVTLLIAAYILWLACSEIGGVIRTLMLGTPEGLSHHDIVQTIRSTKGVADVHRANLWTVQQNSAALTAHVVVEQAAWGNVQWLRATLREALHDTYGIEHITLEMETAPEVYTPTPHHHHDCGGH